jgi:hypothetical protein
MVCHQKKEGIICDDKFLYEKNENHLKTKNVHVIYLDIVTNDDNFTPNSPQIYLS